MTRARRARPDARHLQRDQPGADVPRGRPGATIISLTLIVDEGTDTGPGHIFTDNLNVNGQYITKPGAAH